MNTSNRDASALAIVQQQQQAGRLPVLTALDASRERTQHMDKLAGTKDLLFTKPDEEHASEALYSADATAESGTVAELYSDASGQHDRVTSSELLGTFEALRLECTSEAEQPSTLHHSRPPYHQQVGQDRFAQASSRARPQHLNLASPVLPNRFLNPPPISATKLSNFANMHARHVEAAAAQSIRAGGMTKTPAMLATATANLVAYANFSTAHHPVPASHPETSTAVQDSSAMLSVPTDASSVPPVVLPAYAISAPMPALQPSASLVHTLQAAAEPSDFSELAPQLTDAAAISAEHTDVAKADAPTAVAEVSQACSATSGAFAVPGSIQNASAIPSDILKASALHVDVANVSATDSGPPTSHATPTLPAVHANTLSPLPNHFSGQLSSASSADRSCGQSQASASSLAYMQGLPASQPWHDEDIDFAARQLCRDLVHDMLLEQRMDEVLGLHRMQAAANSVELMLYNTASSRDAYEDQSTLHSRVAELMKQPAGNSRS